MKPLPDPPPRWGRDEISKFFDVVRNNKYSTFANLNAEVGRAIDIDAAYRNVIGGLNYDKNWFVGLFLLRAHSNFLAACGLCWGGQIPECYALLRCCLENALYGLYLARYPNSCESWLRRNDSADHKKKVRAEFKIGKMLNLAKSIDKKEGEVASLLYERAIDYGAHPNEGALMQNLRINESPENVELKVLYLVDNIDHLKSAMKTTAQIGVCSLSLLRLVYRERFDILGVTDALDHIKKGL